MKHSLKFHANAIVQYWNCLRLLFAETGDSVLTIKGPELQGRITGALWGPLNKTIISGGEDGILRTWDTEVGSLSFVTSIQAFSCFVISCVSVLLLEVHNHFCLPFSAYAYFAHSFFIVFSDSFAVLFHA